MNRIQILDCTLRDGGYCNKWEFGFENIRKIISGLVDADIDIIECGFLTDKISYNQDLTKYNNLNQISKVIPENKRKKTYVAMVNYGDFDVFNLPKYDGSSIDGIRIAFHKKDYVEAIEICKQIKEKGYKVFVQAMVTLNYSDDEFLNLINQINILAPYAFYIVDSFGVMKGRDLKHFFNLVDNNLSDDIWVGFHSHNNMQMAYSNAQTLVGEKTIRRLIIDSSVYGMGRGAGNLNTELFIGYLNDNIGTDYKLKPLLSIIDEILNDFYQRNYWGYSLPNFISASHNAHPDYAGYLDDKKTLTVEDMDEIFDMMDDKKKYIYNKDYIEDLYFKYMAVGEVHKSHRNEFKKLLENKKVILIAPGKSSIDEKEIIKKFVVDNTTITISINYEYSEIQTNFIFISNLRRFRELDESLHKKCIVSSNIHVENSYLQEDYRELINNEEFVIDNAGLMAIKMLINYGVKEVYLAGFDGYSHNVENNYGYNRLSFITKNSVLDAINMGMTNVINQFNQQICINFVTKPKYLKIDL